jgi:hypothetical protein
MTTDADSQLKREDNPGLVWAGALFVAAIGAYIMFDAVPGVNWGIWTAAASIGLALVAKARGTLGAPTLLMLATATILAAGTTVTADPTITGLICLSVMLFLAMSMLLAIDSRLVRLSAVFVIASPFVAAGNALGETFKRMVDLSGTFRSPRARGVVRGAVITVPIVLFFALLLAAADPLFATWRDEIGRIIETWSFIPRLIFFIVLLVIVLGAYSYAARSKVTVGPATPMTSSTDRGDDGRWLGATERLILLSSVTALFWLFIAVQLSYLFGNAPRMAGSGMTFAEYARRGFGELSIVATCSVLLILISERFGRLNGHASRVRVLTIALLIAVAIILMSAFYRVSLYEAAYGYTVSRLYAQVYMLVVGAALIAVAVAVNTTLDMDVLFRRVFAVAVAAFAVLVFWNHEGWIASENIDRYRTTGKLDVVYITRDLSPNAIPVIVSKLSALPEPVRTDLHDAILKRYGDARRVQQDQWFEWNLHRTQARAALSSLGIPLDQSTQTSALPVEKSQPDLRLDPVVASEVGR